MLFPPLAVMHCSGSIVFTSLGNMHRPNTGVVFTYNIVGVILSQVYRDYVRIVVTLYHLEWLVPQELYVTCCRGVLIQFVLLFCFGRIFEIVEDSIRSIVIGGNSSV